MIAIKPAHKGLLHKDLGIKKGEKITAGELMAAERKAKSTGNTTLEKRVVFAQNARKWNHA